ncbi:ABC transporter substrate-binding protein [Desulfuromonas sp. TF]|uniref:ABC transporter substrate-binding protein n=1 Tax=Desulfuromonas sp. TF TaxID=1232410 RepID=UPI0004267B8E|nr:ABC transporter substrate-binding protein [Desulfuromonas sp. TF]
MKGRTPVMTRIRSRMKSRLLVIVCGVLMLWAGQAAAASDTVKIGLVLQLTGPFADSGRQMTNAIKAYMAQHGDTVAGKKIELIFKDVTGPVPAVAKRLCQELVVQDKVDFIAGFGLTPDALACAPVATEAKTPLIDMLAATSIITTKSPYIVRTSLTLPQVSAPMAQWAYDNGYRKAYTLVADYGPGHDAEKAFQKAFKAKGGEIVGEVRVPLKNLEFAPYMQRIKDSTPQGLFVFLPTGQMGMAFMRSFEERGLKEAGVTLLATGDLLDDGAMDSMGDATLGVISTYHYSAAHESPENAAYLEAYRKIDPNTRPNGHAIGAYDGMSAIYTVIRELNGKIDGDKAMEILKGLKIASPRGPIYIDPETRDIVQNVYVREAKKVGDKVYNIEFATIENVKDPGKEL